MEQYSQELKVVLEHVIAAKAVAYAEAIDQKFETLHQTSGSKR